MNPVQHRVIEQGAGLLSYAAGWHPMSYVWQDSLAWWVFLEGTVLFGVVFCEYVRRTRNLLTIVAVMVGLACFEAVYGLIQALIPTLGVLWANMESGLGNARGTYINRNHFAGFVEMVWPLGFGMILAMAQLWNRDWDVKTGGVKRFKHFLSSEHIGFQLSIWAVLVFILLALLFSKSRAGITGGFIGFASFIFLVHAGGKRFSWPAWAVMGLGFGFLLFYGNIIGFGEIIGRFLLIDEHAGTAGSRPDKWMDTLAIIRDHPFGIGLRNYEHVMPVYNATVSYGIKNTHAHNDYLQLLAEAGWPGFLALVGGFYYFLIGSIRRIGRIGSELDPVRFYVGIGALCGLISIAFHSFFDFNLQIPANLFYFVVLIGIVYSCFWEKNRVRFRDGESGIRSDE